MQGLSLVYTGGRPVLSPQCTLLLTGGCSGAGSVSPGSFVICHTAQPAPAAPSSSWALPCPSAGTRGDTGPGCPLPCVQPPTPAPTCATAVLVRQASSWPGSPPDCPYEGTATLGRPRAVRAPHEAASEGAVGRSAATTLLQQLTLVPQGSTIHPDLSTQQQSTRLSPLQLQGVELVQEKEGSCIKTYVFFTAPTSFSVRSCGPGLIKVRRPKKS